MQAFRIAGHPLHPAAVHFPIAAWTAAVLGDFVYLLAGDPFWWRMSYWAMATGVVTGLLAMMAGFAELATITAEHPAWRVAEKHMTLMGSCWTVFVLNLVLRNAQTPAAALELWLLEMLSVSGYLLLVLGSFRGATLVYEHGIGGCRSEKQTLEQ